MEQHKRSVAGIAVNGTGKLFIAQRIPGGALGSKWEFPGGKAEEGESDRAALVREYQEEFGLPVETGLLLASASFEHKGDTFSLNAYRVFFKSGEPQDIQLAEHTAWRWAALDEIKKLDFADSDLKLLSGLESYLKQQA